MATSVRCRLHGKVNKTPLIVRISQIEAQLLSCPGVLDVTGTTLNGQAANVALAVDSIPS